MELKELISLVPNFSTLGHPEKVLTFGWFLHVERNKAVFTQSDIRACYKELHMDPPNLSETFTRLLAKKPKVLLPEKTAYKLEGTTRQRFDERYGNTKLQSYYRSY